VGHLGVLDERGSPRVTGDEAAPGLRFVGYVPYPAMIRYAAGEAKRAAKAIAASGALERTHGGRDFSVGGARIAAAEDR
jgi:hypothetical protein